MPPQPGRAVISCCLAPTAGCECSEAHRGACLCTRINPTGGFLALCSLFLPELLLHGAVGRLCRAARRRACESQHRCSSCGCCALGHCLLGTLGAQLWQVSWDKRLKLSSFRHVPRRKIAGTGSYRRQLKVVKYAKTCF